MLICVLFSQNSPH